MKNTTFIYCLCEPGTKIIRYFGKADNPIDRRAKHIREAREGEKGHKANWIRKLVKAGHRPDVFTLCAVPTDAWKTLECAFIAVGRKHGLLLTNLTDGGDGAKGYKHTPEALENFRNRRHSEETLAKMRGRKHTQASRVKMRVKRSVETRKKLSKALRGRKVSEGTRAKLRAIFLHKKSSRNTSGFAGVRFVKTRSAWHATFRTPEKRQNYVGEFKNIEDAVFARNLAIAAVPRKT